MTERGFDTGFWGDPFVQTLSPEGKLLFAYLWTNSHCNQAGLYEITLKTTAFETGMDEGTLPAVLESLQPKVEWYPDDNLVWVKNFVKRQSKSPMFLAAVAKCLARVKNNGMVQDFLAYNLLHSISIPYQQYSQTVPVESKEHTEVEVIPPASVLSCTDTEKEEVSLSFDPFLSLLQALPGWKAEDGDIEWLQPFKEEFTAFCGADVKACADYHSGRAPPGHKGVWKNRLRNWMVKKDQIKRERGADGIQRRISTDRGDTEEDRSHPGYMGYEVIESGPGEDD